ncbi:MAG: hypothetical protein Q8N04_14830 [Nitrospira sp.]|nr:hypothetical protein [Nitrospira sp.]
MDVHIPKAITDGLRVHGVDVLTAQEDGAARLPDSESADWVNQVEYLPLR